MRTFGPLKRAMPAMYDEVMPDLRNLRVWADRVRADLDPRDIETCHAYDQAMRLQVHLDGALAAMDQLLREVDVLR